MEAAVISFLLILVLAFVVAATAAIGSGTNSAALVATIMFFPSAFALYFAPAILANTRKHSQIMPITVLNTLLGWTLIGWVAALVWAYTAQAPKVEVAQ